MHTIVNAISGSLYPFSDAVCVNFRIDGLNVLYMHEERGIFRAKYEVQWLFYK